MTLDNIQSDIAAYADDDPTVSNISSTDYSLRLSFINQSVREYSEAKNWKHLYKEYNVLISTSTGNATVVLPSNFRRPASFPKIANANSEDLFPETDPLSAGQYSSTTKRVEFLGNQNSGFSMRIYGTTLSSGASVMVPYYASAVSLASPSDVTDCPDPRFLVKRTLAYLLETRDDGRWVSMRQEANQILSNMIDNETTVSVASDENRVKTINEIRNRPRIGGW